MRMLSQDEKQGDLFSELLPTHTGVMHLSVFI